AFRGPGASLYGDAAVGGVIQVLTDRANSKSTVTVSAGSFDTFVTDGSLSRRTPSFGGMLSGTFMRTNGASEHASARRATLGGDLDGHVRGAVWHWTLTGTDRTRDDPGALSTAAFQRDPFASDQAFRFDGLDRRNISSAFTIDTPVGNWRHRARVQVAG